MNGQKTKNALRTAGKIAAYSLAGFLSFATLLETSSCAGGNGRYERQVGRDTVYVSRSELDRQMRLKGDEIDDAARLREKIGPLSGWRLRSYWQIFNGSLWQCMKNASGDTGKIPMEELRNGYMRDAGIEAVGDLFGAGDAAFAWERGTAAIEDASFEIDAKKQIRK